MKYQTQEEIRDGLIINYVKQSEHISLPQTYNPLKGYYTQGGVYK